MSNESLVIPSYVTIVQREETTDGRPCYVAYHPELPNCKGQGETSQEAVASLNEATEMVVQHLATHGLHIPAPQNGLSMTATSSDTATLPAIQRVKSVPSYQTQLHIA